jgi:hypothetical protein
MSCKEEEEEVIETGYTQQQVAQRMNRIEAVGTTQLWHMHECSNRAPLS